MMTKIKYITTLLLLLGLGFSQAQGQSSALLDIMSDLEDREGVTSVLVTQKMFELFTKTTDIDVEGESLNEVVSSLEKLEIYEVDLPGNEMTAIQKKISSTLNKDGYEILMKINDDDDDVEIYILEEKDIVKHLFMVANDNSSLQVISLLGNIDLEKISKLSGTLNVEEFELLKKE